MSHYRPRTYHFLGNIIHFLAFPEDTGNRCAIVEIRVAPGAGAPPHHHAGEDENFYVLEGEFAFVHDGTERKAGPGDFVKIPDGAVHAFSCISDTPGRLLCIAAPGDRHDIFFTQASEELPDGTTEFPAPDGPPDMAAILAVADRAGIHILPPEPAPA